MEEDSEDSETTLGGRHQQDRHTDPERFQTIIDGRNVNVRRVPTSEANEILHGRDQLSHSQENHGAQEHHEGQERAPVDEHGLDYSDARGQQQHFGLQDGLPPLQELDTHATSRTKQEQKEEQRKADEAEREFYNQYRNPIARFRAKYPQAPAEFLAVSTIILFS